VVLEVEGHEMLVADACSGLNSLYSLFALGLLYTQVVGARSVARTAIVLAAMVPIAIAANIVRVTALVLVTVHYGEEAAQGFLHGFAGMVVFVTALALLVGVDRLVVIPAKAGIQPKPRERDVAGRNRIPAYAGMTMLAMLAVALALPFVKPRPVDGNAPDLEGLIPSSFGGWRIDPDIAQVPPTPDVQASLERVYRQLVARTYVNDQGERMMLLVAYGGDQSDALKAHRQEGCYRAQGFEIRDLRHGSVAAGGREVPVTRFDAVRGARSEPVTYWFTMGDRVVLSRMERLRVQVSEGLRGRVPDGFLVRVSSISDEPAKAYAAQQSFLAAALEAVPAAQAWRLVGR
jgi:EpsI family protein